LHIFFDVCNPSRSWSPNSCTYRFKHEIDGNLVAQALWSCSGVRATYCNKQKCLLLSVPPLLSVRKVNEMTGWRHRLLRKLTHKCHCHTS
jgi:hypothetical protein